MPTRNGVEIVVKYALFDLTHPDIEEAQADLRQVLRRVGDQLELGVNRNHDNTRAVVKVTYGLEDAALVTGWFQNRTWKDAILQTTDWAQRDQVRAFVNTVAWLGGSLVLIDRTAGTNIGNLTQGGGLAAAFDGTTSQAATACASLTTGPPTFGWVGKTLTAPKIFGRAVVHGSNNAGFWSTVNPPTTINIYGKLPGAAPASSTDGTIIGTIAFTDTTDERAGRTIDSTDFVTQWGHIWARVSTATGAQLRVAELVLHEWA